MLIQVFGHKRIGYYDTGDLTSQDAPQSIFIYDAPQFVPAPSSPDPEATAVATKQQFDLFSVGFKTYGTVGVYYAPHGTPQAVLDNYNRIWCRRNGYLY